MTGFYIGNIKTDMHLCNKHDSYCNMMDAGFNKNNILAENIPDKQYDIYRWTSDKFLKDKLFKEDVNYIIVLEGVILNLVELKEKYHVETIWDLCKQLIKQKGELFHTEFIGNFAGAVYLKCSDTWIVFANKYSSKALFYYTHNGKFAIAHLPVLIKDILCAANLPYSFNDDAAYLLMTYGYMGTCDTFVKEIKKLEAGEYLKIEAGNTQKIIYHRFKHNVYDLKNVSEQEIIDGIDERFRRAIKREYDKDLEYGYKGHLRALTGGMDSRSACFCSHALGYARTVNMTFGQPDNPDEIIARQISKDLGNQIIFLSTTVGKSDSVFLREIDRAVMVNQGLGYYSNTAAAFNRFIQLDQNSYGLLHNANFSETVLTTYLKNPKDKPPVKPLHTDCNLLIHKTPKDHLSLYENEDIYTIYSMFFDKYLLILSLGDVSTVYPTLDPDLVDYCLSIPLEIRKNYNIYYKWLFTKYPQAKKYKLEKLNARIDDPRLLKWWGKLTRYGSPIQYFRCSKDKLPTIVRKVSHLDKKIKPSPIALFPFDYWYENDVESRNYMDRYFSENLNHPMINQELRNDLQMVYQKGNARQKAMALTVLAAAKLFFDK